MKTNDDNINKSKINEGWIYVDEATNYGLAQIRSLFQKL